MAKTKTSSKFPEIENSNDEQISNEVKFIRELKKHYPYIPYEDSDKNVLLDSIRNKNTLIGAAYQAWLNK